MLVLLTTISNNSKPSLEETYNSPLNTLRRKESFVNTQMKFASTPDPPKWIKDDGVVYAVLRGGPPVVVVAILTGEVFKTQANRMTPNVYAEAASRGLETVDLNLKFDLGKRFILTFTKEDMVEMRATRVAVMHELETFEGMLQKIDTLMSGDKLEISSVQALPGGLWDMSYGNLFIAPEGFYPRLTSLGLRIS